jgi:alkylation response protein AidB-like acyl-CoA dehydrogenase
VGAHIFNEIFFNDVRIPKENLVGVENNGWSHLMQALAFERGTSINYTGMLRRFLDELVVYAREQGLFRKPGVRQKLADLAVEVASLRLLAYDSIWKMSMGKKVIYESSRDKANSDRLHDKVSRVGLDILGAYALLDPLHKESRWTRIKGALEHLYYISPGLAIAAGTTNTQRNIVGQFGLQLPRAY